MMGELSTQAAVLRTEGVEKVIAQHPEMKVVQKQTANWRRNEAIDLMDNWLVAGTKIDAVAANNDEMPSGRSSRSSRPARILRKSSLVVSTQRGMRSVRWRKETWR